MEMFTQIRTGDFNFDDEVWVHVSEDAKDLIRKLLVVDPAKRYTVEQALTHKWIAGASPACAITVHVCGAVRVLWFACCWWAELNGKT